VFNATWNAIKYEVSFDADGNVTSGEFDFGSTVTLPQAAAKQGHTFVGWFDEEGNEFTEESTVPVGGVKLTAKYEKNIYNAIFDADFGAWEDGDAVKTVPTEYGAQIVAPADPIKEGYEFVFWDREVGTMSDEDITFIAVWQIQSYDVTWNFDNGEEAFVDNVFYGSSVIVPEDPVKEGYTFAGWNAEIPDAMPANALTFNAVWTINEYTVTWDVDGEATTDTVEYGEEIVAPADPEKEGYTFTGWEGYTDGMTMPAKNVTFTATWKVNSYEVTWNVDGVETTDTVEFGAEIIAPAEPEKEGYTFIGWTPEIPDAMPDEALAFTAVFEINSYTVTWDVDGVTTTDTVEFGDEIVTPAAPEKVGYTFDGWDAEIPGAMPAENLTFKAKWTVNKYDAIFNANGGAFADGSETATVATEYEAAVVAPAAPVKDGFTFVEWTPALAESMPAESVEYTAVWAEGEGTVYTVETYTMDINGEYGEAEIALYATADATVSLAPEVAEGFSVDGDSILEASVAADGSTVLKVYFAREKFIATFDANGGNFNGEATVEVEVYYGASIEEPAAPVMDEYNFTGWDAEIPATMPAEDLSFKAEWELAHTHVTKLVTEDATCTEDGKKYYFCDGCGETVGEVEVIKAKGHVAGDWVVEVEATTESEGLAVKRCKVCNEVVKSSALAKLPEAPATITTEDGEAFVSGSEIVYGEAVVLTVGNIPEGATVEWTVEGEGVEISVSEDGKTCTVTSVESGKAIVKAKVTDAEGNQTVTSTEIVSDACFFQRIVRFFKNIFGSIFGIFFK
ncbi:MAG: InlB B-repeat-containing protein, partial [Clostridia bacterium]|nr:InlB B-repeat-containing protein [Clostridia bacterium]